MGSEMCIRDRTGGIEALLFGCTVAFVILSVGDTLFVCCVLVVGWVEETPRKSIELS